MSSATTSLVRCFMTNHILSRPIWCAGSVAAPTQQPQVLSLHYKLALQQQGSNANRRSGHRIMSTAQHASCMQHHKTVRGHKLAVYCIAYDRAGRHIITGSDDRLVKVQHVACAPASANCCICRSDAPTQSMCCACTYNSTCDMFFAMITTSLC